MDPKRVGQYYYAFRGNVLSFGQELDFRSEQNFRTKPILMDYEIFSFVGRTDYDGTGAFTFPLIPACGSLGFPGAAPTYALSLSYWTLYFLCGSNLEVFNFSN